MVILWLVDVMTSFRAGTLLLGARVSRKQGNNFKKFGCGLKTKM